jgi:hypothetical protein
MLEAMKEMHMHLLKVLMMILQAEHCLDAEESLRD